MPQPDTSSHIVRVSHAQDPHAPDKLRVSHQLPLLYAPLQVDVVPIVCDTWPQGAVHCRMLAEAGTSAVQTIQNKCRMSHVQQGIYRRHICLSQGKNKHKCIVACSVYIVQPVVYKCSVACNNLHGARKTYGCKADMALWVGPEHGTHWCLPGWRYSRDDGCSVLQQNLCLECIVKIDARSTQVSWPLKTHPWRPTHWRDPPKIHPRSTQDPLKIPPGSPPWIYKP